ncbi:hypothetical protein BpHYR1_006550 [Brachionus plicatilis]|uniref:Uncharacterized protein n=1 Tax=Brachionus plicatilis TaxID=10195 RepID=A0A3M7SZ39_BRAPC|nr:hypothetical protein BpHYR1_006550 [Brachionus plicatilis]
MKNVIIPDNHRNDEINSKRKKVGFGLYSKSREHEFTASYQKFYVLLVYQNFLEILAYSGDLIKGFYEKFRKILKKFFNEKCDFFLRLITIKIFSMDRNVCLKIMQNCTELLKSHKVKVKSSPQVLVNLLPFHRVIKAATLIFCRSIKITYPSSNQKDLFINVFGLKNSSGQSDTRKYVAIIALAGYISFSVELYGLEWAAT